MVYGVKAAAACSHPDVRRAHAPKRHGEPGRQGRSRHILGEAPGVVGLAEAVQRVLLDLADPLAGEPEVRGDLFEGALAPVVDAETQSQHGLFPLGERGQHVRDVAAQQGVRHRVVRAVLARQVRHEVYGKTQRRTSTFLAHDEKNEAKVGDRVAITETRPFSRRKRWVVTSVVEKAKEI